MRLYIAEKPSMGMEIAKCLPGPMRRADGYIETQGGTVTWGFGHILRQAEPQEYDERYRSWRAEDLPIVPQSWQLKVADSCAKQFKIVKGLIAKADEIVHAGDPDREGQLLIDEVLEYVGNRKPVRRILLNALDEKSIKSANDSLRDNRDFFNLKQSALARARADWLIGMNLSRAYTLAARRAGHRVTFPVGRVKTPTLALVVRREREIENFKPVDYYIIKGLFQHTNGSFMATWKPKDIQAGLDSEGRLVDKKIAEGKLSEFMTEPRLGKISSYSKRKQQEPQRLPFSLSSLQVLAGKRFGYDPQTVLNTAQKLYERKLTTYPRSDCEYLPTNQFSQSGTILRNIQGFGDNQLAGWAAGANTSIRSRAWNDKKITAHHAIIPTTVAVDAGKLGAVERNIYFLIAQAYIAQFYPVHTFYQTKVEVDYKDELFTASGRTEIDLGWKALYTKAAGAGANSGGITSNGDNASSDGDETENGDSDGSAVLPAIKKNDKVEYLKGTLDQKVTKPPTRFTPATLLAAMKDIHKFVKDPEAKKQLKAVYGIGTEATRATIIDDLIKRKFMTEMGKKKYLQPTQSAYMLIDAMPDELSYPDFTAVWEDRLHSMAEGEGTLEEFIGKQVELTSKLCAKAYDVEIQTKASVVKAGNSTGGADTQDGDSYTCPRCGRGILIKRHGKNGDFWGCSAFPSCRMTCNDKDGKPDLENAQARANSRNYSRRSGKGVSSTFQPMHSGDSGRHPGNNSEFNDLAFSNDYQLNDMLKHEMDTAVNTSFDAPHANESMPWDSDPYMSDAEMAAFNSEFGSNDVFAAGNSYGSYSQQDYGAVNTDAYMYQQGNSRNDRNSSYQRRSSGFNGMKPPKESAMPMEKLAGQRNQADNDSSGSKILCPRCREGRLRRLKGRNGTFWGCSNYPQCTATFNDVNNAPDISGKG